MESENNVKTIKYKHGFKTIPLYYGLEILHLLPIYLNKIKFDKIFVVLGNNVNRHWGNKIKEVLKDYNYKFIFSPVGEKSKTFGNYKRIIDRLFKSNITKESLILSIGGGTIGNLAGFIASTIYRGIRFVHIPTTLIAQADSSIGGKQAINLIYGKNTLGSIYEPEFIFTDFAFLRTLPKKEIRSGIAESIKHALCQDSSFLISLSTKNNKNLSFEKIVERTFKLKIVSFKSNLNELNEPKIFIYGHEIGHVIESLSKGRLSHGESISIGMVCSAKISYKIGYLSKEDLEKHINILSKWNLPTKIPLKFKINSIIAKLEKSGKIKNGDVDLVLLKEIGKPHGYKGKIGTPIKIKDLINYLKECY